MVCCGWGEDLKFGHEQLVKFELSFGNRVCGQHVCTVMIPDSLKTISQDRRGVKQT